MSKLHAWFSANKLVVVLVATAAWVAFGILYFKTISEIFAICWSYEEYSHGLLLPIVSGYFLWEKRLELVSRLKRDKRSTLTLSFYAWTMLLLGCLLFLLGVITSSLYLRWVSLFLSLSGLAFISLPYEFVKLSLPLLLINFLAKPIPDSLVPRLFSPFQMLGAKLSEYALKALNIPVYVQGNIIELPGMQLFVEEACSGMRSLFVVICLAVVLIITMPMTNWARVTLLLCSGIIAMTLNTLRVVATGLLAHYFGIKAAMGFFHTFTGLIVFAVEGLLIFIFAVFLSKISRGKKTNNDKNQERHWSERSEQQSSILPSIFAIVFISFCGIGAGRLTPEQKTGHTQASQHVDLNSLPMQIGEWRGEEAQGLSLKERDTLKLDSYLKRSYVNSSGQRIYLYIGYWQSQSGDYQAAKHSPTICLPSNGWTISEIERVSIGTPNEPSSQSVDVNRMRGSFQQHNQMFYYWFFSGQEIYRNEWQALLFLAKEQFLHNRSDGGIVEVSTSITGKTEADRKSAEQAAQNFLKDFVGEFDLLVD